MQYFDTGHQAMKNAASEPPEANEAPGTAGRIAWRVFLGVGATLAVLVVLGHFDLLGETGSAWARTATKIGTGVIKGLRNWAIKHPTKAIGWGVVLVVGLVVGYRNSRATPSDDDETSSS